MCVQAGHFQRVRVSPVVTPFSGTSEANRCSTRHNPPEQMQYSLVWGFGFEIGRAVG